MKIYLFIILLLVSNSLCFSENSHRPLTEEDLGDLVKHKRSVAKETKSPKCDLMTAQLKTRVERALNWLVDELLWSDFAKTGHTTDLQDTRLSAARLKEVFQSVGELGKTENKNSDCPIPANTLKNWLRSPEAYKDIENMFEQKRTSLEKSGVDPAKISKIFSWGRDEQFSQAADQMKRRVLDALKTILAETDS